MNLSALPLLSNRRLLTATATAAGVIGIAAVIMTSVGDGYPTRVNDLVSGEAWLPSRNGVVTLVDGTTASVDSSVEVGGKGHDLRIAQAGQDAYVADETTHTVRRIDGATMNVGAPYEPFTDDKAVLSIFAGSDHLYVVDTQAQKLRRLQLTTLAPDGGPVSLPSATHDADIVLDGNDTLWALDRTTGSLYSVPNGRSARLSAHAVGGHLKLTGKRAVLVDRKGTVTALGSGGGSTVSPTPPLTGSFTVGGSPDGRSVYLVGDGQVITVCEFTAAAGCRAPIRIAPAGTVFGVPVEAHGVLFVPEPRTGKVILVDLAAPKRKKERLVLPPPGSFTLLERDGYVFFDDPAGNRVGLIRPSGEVIRIGKDSGRIPTIVPLSPKPVPITSGSTRPHPSKPTMHGGSPSSTTPSPPPPPPSFTIELSGPLPRASKPATLVLRGGDGVPAPTSVKWNFGNGRGTTGKTTTPVTWADNRTYHVTADATLPGKQKAHAYADITVGPLSTLTVQSPHGGTITADGIDCGSRCKHTYNSAQPIQLTARPAKGSFLKSWTGDCADLTCTVQSDRDRTVGAVFRSGFLLSAGADKASWHTTGTEDGPDIPLTVAPGTGPTVNTTIEAAMEGPLLKARPETGTGVQVDFPLDAPLAADDKIVAQVGCTDSNSSEPSPASGIVTFSAYAVTKDKNSVILGSSSLPGATGSPNDFSITVTKNIPDNTLLIGLRVEAVDLPEGRYCVWTNPRIEH